MTKRTAKPNNAIKLTRCWRRYPSGRRCRGTICDESSYFCSRHAHLQPPEGVPENLAHELTMELDSFATASEVNQMLYNLFILISEDRICPRRAGVLAYTCSLMLRTLPAIEHEIEMEKPRVPLNYYGLPIVDHSQRFRQKEKEQEAETAGETSSE